MKKGYNRMDNNDRKTSKLAIAGLVVSVAIPSFFFLCVLVFESLYKQLNGALEIFMLLLLILPFIALPLSIAGMVIAKKKDRKGLVPGTIGVALSVIEIIFVVITFLGYLRYEKAPGHSLDIVSPFSETSSEAVTSGSEQEIQYIYTTGTKQLTSAGRLSVFSKSVIISLTHKVAFNLTGKKEKVQGKVAKDNLNPEEAMVYIEKYSNVKTA